MDPIAIITALVVVGGITIMSSLRILFEYQRGVIFRLGKLVGGRGPGLIFLLPFGIERMRKMDLRIIALDIHPQDTITKDNVSVTVNAVVYFRVADPTKAVVEIEDYYFATSQLAQTTLRSVIGQSELDELLAERDRINDIVRSIIDQGTDAWGIEVTGVEVKDIGLPPEMKRAMARQAEAERERRAKVISAEGEFQASRRLAEAAKVLEEAPAAIQLRFMQTVVEIAAENNSTTLFPIPIDMFAPFTKGRRAPAEVTTEAAESEAPLALPSGATELLEGLGVDVESALSALPEGATRSDMVAVARRALGLGDGGADDASGEGSGAE